MRSKPLLQLLQSVKAQTLYPNQILIIDGSKNDETENLFLDNYFENLEYFKVTESDRGLTKQRNYGIDRVMSDCEIVCFLDDDTILASDYFEKLIATYRYHPEALGVGGYITNEVDWQKTESSYKPNVNEFYYDGYVRREGSRFVLCKILGLNCSATPGFLPEYSHARSVVFLPPSGKIYEVELFMGGVSSFRKEVFDSIGFSTYFEGYGLYEDADFTLRLSKLGKLFVNTSARLEHYHDNSGRPNKYQYGKMVVRNGWYVWRLKWPNPSFKARLKWHFITILLMLIRLLNSITKRKKKEAFTDFIGRLVAWFSLIINKPKIQY
jgi:GT2 family glycosyltransferase